MEREQEYHGTTSRTQERATYAHEFIPAAAVPPDFFDPAALRALEPDPQAALDRPPPGFPLYWLGAQFPGAPGVPPLALGQSNRTGDAAQRFFLAYRGADALPPGQVLLRLTEYARTDWETGTPGEQGLPGPCWTPEELLLPQGRATLFRGFRHTPPDACPTGHPHDLFVAHVDLGETIVVVEPAWPDQTREGLEAVVRALRPRTPPR